MVVAGNDLWKRCQAKQNVQNRIRATWVGSEKGGRIPILSMYEQILSRVARGKIQVLFLKKECPIMIFAMYKYVGEGRQESSGCSMSSVEATWKRVASCFMEASVNGPSRSRVHIAPVVQACGPRAMHEPCCRHILRGPSGIDGGVTVGFT